MVQVQQCETAQREKHQWTGHPSTSVAAYACYEQEHQFKLNEKSESYTYAGGMREERPWSASCEQLVYLKKSLITSSM